MRNTRSLQIFRAVASFAALFVATRLSADVVETKNGARIVGKITKIDAGSIYVSTDFAGDLTIKQSEVTAITTEGPLSVRLADGTRVQGPIATQNGAVQVTGPEGTVTSSVSKIAAVWAPGEKDPELVALESHWSYEATVDVEGTTGNKNQLGTAAGFRAKLTAPESVLQFYTGYNRQVTSGVQSADQFKAGVDYADNFAPTATWFVRDEGGFDRIMDIRFYDTAAAGAGFDMVKNTNDQLTGRLGLAYRYDGYYNPSNPTVSSAAGDVEIANNLKFATSEFVTHIVFVPAFSNFSNFIAEHDSFYQIPLVNPAWKLRLGVENDYNSMPGKGIQRLDTTYYTRLILDWQ